MREAWTESNERFDAVVTEPRSASGRSCISGQHKFRQEEDEIDKEEKQNSAEFCKWILKTGVFAVSLIEIYIVDE